MRRAIARGRVFPQSYSTDRRYGRLSLKACALFPLMWANADDQGRLCGDPEEIKYAICPNIDHISKVDVPSIIQELSKNNLIKVYDTPKSPAVQIIDWWDVQRLQWAWPSEFPPPDDWLDKLRYKKGASTVITQNWPGSGEHTGDSSGEIQDSRQVNQNNRPGGDSAEQTEKPSSFPRTPFHHPEETGKSSRRGSGKQRRNSPERSGELSGEKNSSPTAARYPDTEILERLTVCFRKEWGRVPSGNINEIIPREPDVRESVQLRDLAKELSAASCPIDYVNRAFRDAAGRPDKMHISYVRAILLDWLGVERTRSP
ncbi:MAG: hypothetical protein WC370_00775 [Dehalococcoidales bacterium]